MSGIILLLGLKVFFFTSAARGNHPGGEVGGASRVGREATCLPRPIRWPTAVSGVPELTICGWVD